MVNKEGDISMFAISINSLALIWNLIGVYQYLVQVYQSELDKMG